MSVSLRALAARLLAAVQGPDRIPLAWTLRGYRGERLAGDLTAGATVAALTVPLSIGYAAVAGLPPEMGLYASVAPLLAYAVFGSGRRLIVGPDAASAAMIAATIAPLAATADDRVRLASALGLLVAGAFVGMRLARLGFLADLLSRPILVGYLTGVGITVAVGQVPKILGGPALEDALQVLSGLDLGSTGLAVALSAMATAARASGANLASIAVGGGVLAAILLGRRFLPRVPMALPALIVALVASAVLDLQSHGVSVLGPVPGGLPPLRIPVVSPSEVLALLPGAIGLALLTFADTTATGRSFASRAGERTDADRELVALAAADAAGSLTGGYAVSSSASRTAAATQAGSSTQLAGVIGATAVLVVLLLLTAPLAYLPTPALGAVILASVLGLIDVPQIRSIWVTKRSEGAIAIAAMTGVVLYGTLVGVAVAVMLAALNVVRRAALPAIDEEGRLPDGRWRSLARGGGGRRVEGAIVVWFAGPMFFANASALQARVRGLVAERADAVAVVIDLGATSDVDLTAAAALGELAAELVRGGRRLAVARPLAPVRDLLRTHGLADLMGATGGTHGSVDDAVRGLGLDPARTATAAGETVGGLRPRLAGEPEPGGERGPDNRLLLRVLAGAAAVVVVAGLLGIVIGAWHGTKTPGPTPVPNLLGLSLSRAGTTVDDAGFVLGVPSYVPRTDVPEGTVVFQVPSAGTIADPGSIVELIVATRQITLVPDVVGVPEAQAIVDLTGAGFAVRRTGTAYDAIIPAGAVVWTDPAGRTSVAVGSNVGYVVSAGPEPTPSPVPTPAVSAAPPASTVPTPSGVPTPPAATSEPSVSEPASAGPSQTTEPGASSAAPAPPPGASSVPSTAPAGSAP